MNCCEVYSIGKVCINEEGTFIKLEDEFIPALKALDGFGHINIIWWFSDFDSQEFRAILETEQPYKKAPEKMGIFATRSPMRPNPIALTAAEVINIDYQKGVIQIAYIDANDNTPILDIKPYTPSLDRVEAPKVPYWCEDWPRSLEQSADFQWDKVFNF